MVDIPQLTTGNFYCIGLHARVDLQETVQVDAGIYASSKPPFHIDDWWQEQLGKIQVNQINGCSLFLLALTDDPAFERYLPSHLQSYLLALLVQGVGYSRAGITLGGRNSTSGLRVSSIGTHNTYYEPNKVIARSVTKDHLLATPELAKAIDFIFADKKKFLRLRKGLNAFLDGIGQNQLHTRLHCFVRAIDAIIKPKQGDGTRKFKYRCQFFAGRQPQDVSLLHELYELRSAAEHLNPMDDKLTDYPSHERDNIKGLRTLQGELLAAFVYRKILKEPQLRKHLVSDDTIDSLWLHTSHQLMQIWGSTINFHTARGNLYDRSTDGKFLDFLA